MKITPLFDRVVLESENEESQTKSGILLAQTSQEKPLLAKVIAVGKGNEQDDGTYSKMYVKQGDKILYSKYAGSIFKIDGKEVTIVRQTDILAIINEE